MIRSTIGNSWQPLRLELCVRMKRVTGSFTARADYYEGLKARVRKRKNSRCRRRAIGPLNTTRARSARKGRDCVERLTVGQPDYALFRRLERIVCVAGAPHWLRIS